MFLNGNYCGLTVAHLFDNFLNGTNDLTSECQEGGPEFAFVSDDDQEPEPPSEVNLSDIVITSQGAFSNSWRLRIVLIFISKYVICGVVSHKISLKWYHLDYFKERDTKDNLFC